VLKSTDFLKIWLSFAERGLSKWPQTRFATTASQFFPKCGTLTPIDVSKSYVLPEKGEVGHPEIQDE
jgi:hypothetical protein